MNFYRNSRFTFSNSTLKNSSSRNDFQIFSRNESFSFNLDRSHLNFFSEVIQIEVIKPPHRSLHQLTAKSKVRFAAAAATALFGVGLSKGVGEDPKKTCKLVKILI